MSRVMAWNEDKKHRCPRCHTVAMSDRPNSLGSYQCCKCGTEFARFPRLAWLGPRRGVVCAEHGGQA